MLGEGVVDGRRLLQRLVKNPVDWIWVVHSWTSFDQTTRESLKQMGVRLFGFGLSDPRKYAANRLQRYDIYATNDLRTFQSISSPLAIWNPPSCDKDFHTNLRLERDIDVLFYGLGRHPLLGSYRQDFIRELRAKLPQVNIHVFGRNWLPGMANGGHCGGQQFLHLLNRAKIGIDITRGEAPLGRRNFEMPACGICTVFCRTPDTQELFSDYDWPMYETIDELAGKIEYYLSHETERSGLSDHQYSTIRVWHDVNIRVNALLLFTQDYMRGTLNLT
jgi:hypothetical protein